MFYAAMVRQTRSEGNIKHVYAALVRHARSLQHKTPFARYNCLKQTMQKYENSIQIAVDKIKA